MSAAQDVRDVLDLPSTTKPTTKDSSYRRPPAKKLKTVEKKPDALTRELYALIGETPPPVAMKLGSSHLKKHPRWAVKPRHWEWKPFANPARTDDLVLHHWSPKENNGAAAAAASSEGEDAMQVDDVVESDYRFARFNIKPDVLEYTDDEYNMIYNHDGWTREETDYLFRVCRDYDLRFFHVADAYDFPGADRSLEDIKHRYYSVTRSVLAQRKPTNQMSAEELQYFNLLEFDKDKEVSRKKLANVLFNRTPEEVREEELLLIEMKRILANQNRLLDERQDLFNRLDAPHTTGNIAAYMGSQGLANLSMLMAAASSDKSKKRKSIAISSGGMNIDTTLGSQADGRRPSQTPTTAAATPTTATSARGERDKEAKEQRRFSAIRQLTEAEEKQFGVVRHEKIASGVYLRSSKIAAVKGINQPKVQAALQELGIPVKLTMATTKTCQKMEQLNQVISMALDAKKCLEKLEQELRIERTRLENLG